MTEQQKKRQDLLAHEKVPKLIFRMALPATAGMTVNALYNIIDTVFIGQGVGALAIGGLAVSFSVQTGMFAFALLLATGAASIISRALGAGDAERATMAAFTAWGFGFTIVLILLILAQIFLGPLVKMIGATESIAPYAHEYLRVILFGFPIIALTVIGHNIARAEGHPEVAILSLMVGAISNICLDALFIFGFNMGVRGAAFATILARTLSLVILIRYFVGPKSFIRTSRKYFTFDFSVIRELFALGLPAFARHFGLSILIMTVNNVLATYGTSLHVSAYGVISRLMLFGLMPMFGVNQGFQPVAGFNWGAGNLKRTENSLYVALVVSFIYAGFLFAFLMLFPDFVFRIFTQNEELIAIGTRALRIVFLLVPLVALQLVGATFYLAIGKAIPAFILTLSRQVILLIPLVLILPRFYGEIGIWYSFPLADGISVVVTALFLLRQIKIIRRKVLLQS